MPNHGFGGRLPLPLDDYKAHIIDRLLVQHQSQGEIVAWLQNEKNLKVDVRTLQRYLKKWDVNQKDRTEDSEQIRNRIQFMFCKLGASDNDMLSWLQKEGFKITRRGLVRIRKDLGLKRNGTKALGLELHEHGYTRNDGSGYDRHLRSGRLELHAQKGRVNQARGATDKHLGNSI